MSRIPSEELRGLVASREIQAIAERSWEERVRLTLTQLGTTFIKFGQMLSTRDDLVGSDLAVELSRLQSKTPADPPESVRRMIRAQLGRDPEDLFARFEPEAFASASIGQVHRAWWPTVGRLS